MKKIWALLLVLVFALVLMACSPVAQSKAVQLPGELITIIGFFVLVALTAFAKWVFDKFGIDIKDRAAEIAAAVSAVIVLFINYGLGLIPAAYDSWISAIFSFLIVLLGGVGTFSLLFRNKKR